MSSSEDVTVCTCSQLMGCMESMVEASDSWIVVSKWSDMCDSSVEMPAMRFVGIMVVGLEVWSEVECALSGRIILSGSCVPVGYLERASGVLFLTPGMWIILNL